jgi:hypothetical protein
LSRLAALGSNYVPKPPINTPRKLPRDVARKLAGLAKVPTHERDAFYEDLSQSVAELWQVDRRGDSAKPGLALVTAAKAARTLQKAFDSLNKQDRAWVDNIRSSPIMQFEAGEINDLESTILNLAIVFCRSVGKPAPVPRRFWETMPLKIKDQMLRELVFSLLRAGIDRGKKPFRLDQNAKTGTLLDALDELRDHLPPGLVKDPLPVRTIQKLKSDFARLAVDRK